MFQQVKVDVSKREGGEFKKIGDIQVSMPMFDELLKFIANPAQAKDEKDGKPLIDEDTGLPIWEADEANWIQDAILKEVVRISKSRLAKDSVELKNPEQKIPSNWETLIEKLPRGAGGKGLEIARQFKEAFEEWVSKQGLSEVAAKTLVVMVSNRNALSVQPQAVKDKVFARLTAFAEQLDSEQLEKFMRPLEAAQEACKAQTADNALEF